MSKGNNYDLDGINRKLNAQFNGVSVNDVIENGDGSFSFVMGGTEKGVQGFLNSGGKTYTDLPYVDKNDVSKLRRVKGNRATASITRRDALGADYLDLSVTPNVLTAKPQDLYQRSMEYYKTRDVYGSSIDLLTNFASKGYKNDIDDPNIRNFYNNWVIDTGFTKIVEQIFFEFFRSGFVRTYKVVGKYIPKVNSVSTIPGASTTKVNEDVANVWFKKREVALKEAADEANEKAAKKIKWSKDYLPIRYTVLNPTHVEVEKSSILLDQQLISLKAKALESVKELLETPPADLTEHQKLVIKSITAEMRKAAIDGSDLPLDPYLVGSVDYRRQPYEAYPFPRGVRAFESMEYKKSLRDADYSTLDGISNYILVVTIGNDSYPIKSQDELETVSELFNTPAKSYDVFWNHTLKVERVQPSDVGDILGKEKYAQVNDDITGAFGVVRALIDGVGNPSAAAADLAVKALIEEVHYARREVERWIYAEYRDVAEAMGFDRYPKVRFDDMILKDELLMMNTIQGMIDRRIISYRTGHDMLGLDHDTVLSELAEEMPLVVDGTLGILGSPYQQFQGGGGGGQVQETQKAPKGTPSEGRPKGKEAKTPAPAEKPNDKKPSASEASMQSTLGVQLDRMSLEEIAALNKFVREKTMKRLEDPEE